MGLQGYWADLKAPDFEGLPADLVVVQPIGAIEQHGPHLPLSVDRDLVDAVAMRCLEALAPTQNVLILPTLAVTKSDEHDSFAGTLSLSVHTLLATLADIGASLSRAGVARLVFLNGHGGNTATLEIAARDLRIAQNMIVATSSWFGFADLDGVIHSDASRHDIHAGEIETSAMLAARADLVDMTRAANFEPAMIEWETKFKHIGLSGQAARPAWVSGDLHPSGASGNAAAADADKGEKMLASAALNFAKFLAEFAQFDHRRLGDG